MEGRLDGGPPRTAASQLIDVYNHCVQDPRMNPSRH